MQGRVSISLVRLLHEFLERHGVDPVPILRESKPADDPIGVEYISVRRWAALLDLANQSLVMPAFGLALGASICASHLGVVGYLTRNCSTLGEALNRMHHYERLVYELNSGHLKLGLTGVTLEWGTEMGRPGQLADECALAIVIAYAREFGGAPNIGPQEVKFVNPVPASLQPYQDFFGCPVTFGQPKTALRFSYATLARRIPKHEPTLLALLEAQARERLRQLPPADPLLANLHDIIAALLPEGQVTLAACASRLHCSPRTLQRRLVASDVNFQTLLDEVRSQLADAYIGEGRIKLAEVALLLGFADQATFTRAFTRWNGVSPARWRARLLNRPEPGEPDD